MCIIADEFIREGRLEGRVETLVNLAKRLKDKGFSLEEVREIMPEFEKEKLMELYE